MEHMHVAATPGGRPLLIGITTRHGAEAWVSRNTHNYVAAVRDAAAEPLLLAPDTPAVLPDGRTFAPDAAGRLPDEILGALDGLILSGGGDVHPRYFDQPLAGAEPDSIDLRRDELELPLARGALARDLPLFAICRGCQLLNVAAGGSMIQHLDGHRTPQGEPTRFHDVRLAPGSRLQALAGEPLLPVNTFHHQGLDRAALAPLFTPSAFADPDAWLVEAYESRSHRWVLGVQWHPERQFELAQGHRQIWASFFEACRAYAAGR